MSSLLLAASFTMLIVSIASDEKPSMRIIGGVQTSIKDFPYMATVHGWNPFKTWYYCGGGIIAEQWIITVAHCLPIWFSKAPVPDLYVAVGLDEKKKTFQNKLEIEGYFRHPEHALFEDQHDIALIKLVNKIQFNEKVQKLQLPRKNEEQEYTGNNKRVTVAGWGMEKENGSRSEFLRTVSFAILADSLCEHDHNFNKTIHICAGTIDGSKDTCNGDSGSPLVVESKNGGGFTVLGLTSFGTGGPRTCGRKNSPGAYTRMSYYLDWIDEVMKKNMTEVFGETFRT